MLSALPALLFRSPSNAKQNKSMKIRNNCKKTAIAIVAATLLYCVTAQAGSTKPNPAALAKSAAAMSEASRVIENEVHLLLTRLAKGDEFTKQFDQAAYKKDAKQLTKLMRQAGVKKSTITIEKIDSDFSVKVRMCYFIIFCYSYEISW